MVAPKAPDRDVCAGCGILVILGECLVKAGLKLQPHMFKSLYWGNFFSNSLIVAQMVS